MSSTGFKFKKKTNTDSYFKKVKKTINIDNLEEIAEDCLKKFIDASPNQEIAKNWSYEIQTKKNKVFLFFNNSTIQNGENMAIIIDVGHATKEGKWIEGEHYLDKPTKEAYDLIIKETQEALSKL